MGAQEEASIYCCVPVHPVTLFLWSPSPPWHLPYWISPVSPGLKSVSLSKKVSKVYVLPSKRTITLQGPSPILGRSKPLNNKAHLGRLSDSANSPSFLYVSQAFCHPLPNPHILTHLQNCCWKEGTCHFPFTHHGHELGTDCEKSWLE